MPHFIMVMGIDMLSDIRGFVLCNSVEVAINPYCPNRVKSLFPATLFHLKSQ